MKAKILIVGGGAMGTSVALHAATRCDPLREPVILIEKDRLGAGSSGRAQAIIHQGYSDRRIAGMARDALKVYASFEQHTGRSIGFRQTGVLFLTGAATAAKLEADIEMQLSIGIDVRRVDADEIRKIVPGIEVDDDAVGAFEQEGGFVDSTRTIQSLATLARSKGVVTRVGVKNPTILVEDGRAVGVETSAGSFFAPQIVLATGPWTPVILKGLGAELPLRAVKTQQHFMAMPSPATPDDDLLSLEHGDPMLADFETRFTPDPFALLPVAHPVIFDLEKRFCARCEPRRGRTRISRLGLRDLEEITDPESLPEHADEAFSSWARQTVSERLPVYRDQADLGSQAAWLTLTPDERPIVGPVEALPGLYVVAGFSGNDFQLAPSIGEGLAQMLLGEPVSAFDPEYLSLARFQQV